MATQIEKTWKKHEISDLAVLYFAEKPDAPQDLVKGEVFYDKQSKPNIKVVWKPPKYNGGSPVSHYIVEHKTVKTEWSTAAKTNVTKTEYSFQVKKSETYTVRSRAVNKLGVGEAADVTVKFTGKSFVYFLPHIPSMGVPCASRIP